MNLQRAKRIEKKDFIEVELENGAVLKSKTVILSTGARWRTADVPGETNIEIKGLPTALTVMVHCLPENTLRSLAAEIQGLRRLLIWQGLSSM